MGTVSCSQPTDYQSLKMGVYDGVYQLDMSQADPNWAALHKEMGIPEADTKAMISGGNVHTMTVMENKDGSFTTSTNNTVVPHHNSSFTSKPGEIKKMENVMKLGEQWEIEMPGFGKMTGVFMEHGDCFSSCMKIGEKTINVKGKVTGDFIVEELDVDGSLASRMKQILVRQ